MNEEFISWQVSQVLHWLCMICNWVGHHCFQCSHEQGLRIHSSNLLIMTTVSCIRLFQIIYYCSRKKSGENVPRLDLDVETLLTLYEPRITLFFVFVFNRIHKLSNNLKRSASYTTRLKRDSVIDFEGWAIRSNPFNDLYVIASAHKHWLSKKL